MLATAHALLLDSIDAFSWASLIGDSQLDEPLRTMQSGLFKSSILTVGRAVTFWSVEMLKACGGTTEVAPRFGGPAEVAGTQVAMEVGIAACLEG